MLQRIKLYPQVCGGRPTIRGLRFTEDFVLKLISTRSASTSGVITTPHICPVVSNNVPQLHVR